jgi:transcriptional repressor NrdR
MTEVPTSKVGQLAMAKLQALDHIAYIRFASVYESFEGLEDLKREVDNLYEQKGSKTSAR